MSALSRAGLIGLVSGLLCASPVGAQQVSSLKDLDVLRTTNTRITVTDTNGREFRGTIAEASDALLSLRIAGTIRQFGAGEIQSVRARTEDRLADGALIGAAIGGGLSALMFLDNECRDDPVCYSAVAVYAGAGALTGLGIDALIHREVVVYSRSQPATQRVLTVTPFVARGRGGVRLTFRY